MVHTRRKFYDVYTATKSPLAHEALQRIGALYAIEADIRGQTAEHRKQVRQLRSRPLVEAMHAWLTELLGRLSGRSTLAQAIRYAPNHWKGLIRFLDDGRFELDTNSVERAMRPVALGRKNALFAGADSGGKHWAIVATLIQTAKLNNVEPLVWLTDVLKRIVSGQTKRNQLDTLLPWNWKQQGDVAPLNSGETSQRAWGRRYAYAVPQGVTGKSIAGDGGRLSPAADPVTGDPAFRLLAYEPKLAP